MSDQLQGERRKLTARHLGVWLSSDENVRTYRISIVRTVSQLSRLYHINSEIDMHIFSIFGRLYHINSETYMHIFSCLNRLFHITSQIFVYCTLLHPAGYFLNSFLSSKTLIFVSIPQLSIIYLSFIYLSSIYQSTVYHLSISYHLKKIKCSISKHLRCNFYSFKRVRSNLTNCKWTCEIIVYD